MANPVLQDTGTTDWQNNQNTWRAEDGEWLQARSVIRSASFATTHNPTHAATGSVKYALDEQTLGVTPDSGVTWLRAPMAQYIDTGTDTTSSVVLKHRSAGSGIALGSAGAVTVAGTFTASSGAVIPSLTMGSATVTSSGDNITVGSSAGTMTVQKKLHATGQFEADGTSVFDGSVSINSGGTANTFTVTGLLNANGGISSTTGTFSGAVSTPSVVANTNVTVDGTGIYRTGSPARGFLIGATDITLSVPSGGQIILDDGSPNTTRVAGFIISATPPSTDYPEGTVWFEVP